jgi:hypothetical protein
VPPGGGFVAGGVFPAGGVVGLDDGDVVLEPAPIELSPLGLALEPMLPDDVELA